MEIHGRSEKTLLRGDGGEGASFYWNGVKLRPSDKGNMKMKTSKRLEAVA